MLRRFPYIQICYNVAHKIRAFQLRPDSCTANCICDQGLCSRPEICQYSNTSASAELLLWHCLQSIILLLGGLISVMAILTKVPGGIAAVAAEGHRNNKLSLGGADWSWEERTVPTVLSYAAVHYMTKFITFQDAVQRYLAVPSHKVRTTPPDHITIVLHASCTCAPSQTLTPLKPNSFHARSCLTACSTTHFG